MIAEGSSGGIHEASPNGVRTSFMNAATTAFGDHLCPYLMPSCMGKSSNGAPAPWACILLPLYIRTETCRRAGFALLYKINHLMNRSTHRHAFELPILRENAHRHTTHRLHREVRCNPG